MLPPTPFAGVNVNAESPQIVIEVSLITGFGFTVIVTLNGKPGQLLELRGVIVYSNVAATFVVFTRFTPLMLFAFVPATPPVIAPVGVETGADQLYVVLTGTILPLLFDGKYANAESLQIVIEVSFKTGVGLIVTRTLNVSPGQDPAAPDKGRTLYTSVCATFVRFFKLVPLITPTPVV
jgi:hypothetical protein